MGDDICVDVFSIQSGDAILLRYEYGSIPMDVLRITMQNIKGAFPDHTVIPIPKDIDLQVVRENELNDYASPCYMEEVYARHTRT